MVPSHVRGATIGTAEPQAAGAGELCREAAPSPAANSVADQAADEYVSAHGAVNFPCLRAFSST